MGGAIPGELLPFYAPSLNPCSVYDYMLVVHIQTEGEGKKDEGFSSFFLVPIELRVGQKDDQPFALLQLDDLFFKGASSRGCFGDIFPFSLPVPPIMYSNSNVNDMLGDVKRISPGASSCAVCENNVYYRSLLCSFSPIVGDFGVISSSYRVRLDYRIGTTDHASVSVNVFIPGYGHMIIASILFLSDYRRH